MGSLKRRGREESASDVAAAQERQLLPMHDSRGFHERQEDVRVELNYNDKFGRSNDRIRIRHWSQIDAQKFTRSFIELILFMSSDFHFVLSVQCVKIKFNLNQLL